MTTTTRNNKKIVAGVAAAAAAVIAIGAGTFALFDDTEAGPNASATAGTLDLEPGTGADDPLLTAGNIAPGFTETAVLKYTNSGTIDGILDLTFVVTGDENGCNEAETADELTCADDVDPVDGTGTNSELLTELQVSVDGGATYVDARDLADILAVSLPAGETATYNFVFDLPGTTDNRVQSDDISIMTSAFLEQDPTDVGE